jgi:DNA-binding NtrC family response regulator
LVCELVGKATPGLPAHVSLIEQTLLRPWPGNVRELAAEIRAAALSAQASGAARVDAGHLRASAGMPFAAATADAASPSPAAPLDEARRRDVEDALRRHGGNVTAAARALGMHRNQLRRLIERHRIPLNPQ